MKKLNFKDSELIENDDVLENVSLEDSDDEDLIDDAKDTNIGQLDEEDVIVEDAKEEKVDEPKKEDDEFLDLSEKEVKDLKKLLSMVSDIEKLVKGDKPSDDKKDDKKEDKKDDKKEDKKEDKKDAIDDIDDIALGDENPAPLDEEDEEFDEFEEDEDFTLEDSKKVCDSKSKVGFGSIENKTIKDSVSSDDDLDEATKVWIARYNKLSHTN